MYDRRIIRGNTYAQHTLPAVSLFNVSIFCSLIYFALEIFAMKNIRTPPPPPPPPPPLLLLSEINFLPFLKIIKHGASGHNNSFMS
jgi:hypothetical protein